MKKLPFGFTTFMKTERGFTLIELLIVVAIIGILSVLGIYGYTTALKISRDAKRQADLKIIQAALEQYHNDQHSYSSTNPLIFMAGMNLTDPGGTKVYLNNVPTDPIYTTANQSYRYVPFRDRGGGGCGGAVVCQFYCLYAVMEIGTSQSSLCTPHLPRYTLEVTPP